MYATGDKRTIALESPSKRPKLAIRKLGIISRDYRKQFPKKAGKRDFSLVLGEVLKIVDDKRCDAALFSLYSIVPRRGYSVKKALTPLKHVRVVFLEMFQEDGADRDPDRFVVYYRSKDEWFEYELKQQFGSITRKSRAYMKKFVDCHMPKRMLGNCCVLLCGESNGVNYSQERRVVEDKFRVRESIPKDVKVILNPVHDRMTRPEMNLKREFLSKKKRWVISVWNKGKRDKNGKTKDGPLPAWKAFHNGVEQKICPLPNDLGLEVGILSVSDNR